MQINPTVYWLFNQLWLNKSWYWGIKLSSGDAKCSLLLRLIKFVKLVKLLIAVLKDHFLPFSEIVWRHLLEMLYDGHGKGVSKRASQLLQPHNQSQTAFLYASHDFFFFKGGEGRPLITRSQPSLGVFCFCFCFECPTNL